MDQKTENVVAYPSFILLFLTFLVLSLTHSGWMLVLAGLLLGAGLHFLFFDPLIDRQWV